MKTRLRISCLLLAALMLFALAACGKDSPEPSQRRKERSRQSHLRSRRLNQRYIHPCGICPTMKRTAGSTKKMIFMMMKISPRSFW